ncbi:unnamed protein product, partial [Trichobilharzia regenti]
MKSASSRSDYELRDDDGAVKKPVVATNKPLLSRVLQATPEFVQKNRVTVSESSSDSTSFQGITESKSSTAVIKEFENDEFDHTNGGKVDICDNGHDSAHSSLVDHDETSGMPPTTESNKGSVQLESEVELKADAVAEGMDTHETVSVNDHRVAHLSTDIKSELELIIKESSGGNLAVRQTSKSRTTSASDAPLSSSTCVTQSSLVLSSTMKGTSINSRVLCYDYTSISALEKTKDIAQFNEDMPNERLIVEMACTNKGLS